MLYTLLLRDIIEVLFYSSCTFAFCTWLKTDKTKNILVYFFAYCTLSLTAWILQLPTLTPFLFSYAPVALLLFIVLHERTLQRNLVALCTITPARNVPQDWLDTIISSCLTIINTNRSITIVIEQKDSLDHFLVAPFIINADINKNVLEILLASPSYDEQKMIWLDSSGKIRSINASWVADTQKNEDAVFYTLQTDAIMVSAHPTSRTFTVISNGTETKNIAAHQARTFIKKQQHGPSSPKQKGAYRENSSPEKSLPL